MQKKNQEKSLSNSKFQTFLNSNHKKTKANKQQNLQIEKQLKYLNKKRFYMLTTLLYNQSQYQSDEEDQLNYFYDDYPQFFDSCPKSIQPIQDVTLDQYIILNNNKKISKQYKSSINHYKNFQEKYQDQEEHQEPTSTNQSDDKNKKFTTIQDFISKPFYNPIQKYCNFENNDQYICKQKNSKIKKQNQFLSSWKDFKQQDEVLQNWQQFFIEEKGRKLDLNNTKISNNNGELQVFFFKYQKQKQ